MTRPQSAMSFPLALAALSAGLLVIWLLAPWRHIGWTPMLGYAAMLPCLSIVMVIALGEWLLPSLRAPSVTRLAGRALRPLNMRRVGVRLLGLAVTLGLVAFAYWLLPEYSGSFYGPFWLFLRSAAPFGLLVPVYFIWADTRMADTEDEYWAFGSLCLGNLKPGHADLLKNHLLGWLVKAYFLPLMTVYLNDEMRGLYEALGHLNAATMPLYQIFYHLSYAVDLLFCVVGYSMPLRIFDAQIRSVEPTVGGWVVALICYQPFYSVIGRYYLQYEGNIYWDNWLQPWPALRAVWGVTIIALASIYALCTVSFGLRFSNLTNRGVITSGPYRFTKHPAYIAKNLSWWLISVPFISDHGWPFALRNCCLLALVNLVYFARARTEERHLSRDATYVAYALWINEHGALRGIARLLPFMRYRAPVDLAPSV